jgi:GntR family transcriptional repressor for pyruvate dehydrogenase complex
MTGHSAHLTAIERMDVFREVLHRIDQHIEGNHLKPGDRLPSDRELAATLQVSRPLVRQAIKVLESLGRVTAQQGSGTYVQDASHRVAVRELMRGLTFDRMLLGQVLPARIAIELEVLRAAFERRSPANLGLLRRALEQRERQLTDDVQEASLDLTFEATLGRVCGNEVLRRLQALVHDVWLEAQIAEGVAPEGLSRLHHEHQEVFEAFAAGELDEALRRFRDHLNNLSEPNGWCAESDDRPAKQDG